MLFICPCTGDTFYGTVYSKGPNGGSTVMTTGGWGDFYYSYAVFDLTGSPSTASTRIARLWLYTDYRANDPNSRVHRVTSNWNEATLSSTSFPSQENTPTYGNLPFLDGWNSVDITTLYNLWKAGTPNYGISMRPQSTGNNNVLRHRTKEYGSGEFAPYLEIETYSRTTGLTVMGGVSSMSL